MDYKPPKVVIMVSEAEEGKQVYKIIDFLESVEEVEPQIVVTMVDGEEVIDFDFTSNSTGKLELTTYPKIGFDA
jgi:hypothetical protein